MDNRNIQTPATVGSPATLVGILTVLSILTPAAGFVGGVARMLASVGQERMGIETPLAVIGSFLAGGVSGALLWGAAWLIRRAHDASLIQRRLLSLLDQAGPLGGEGPRSQAAAAKQAADAASLERFAELMAEINTNVMLTEAQREVKRQRQQSQIAENLVAAASRAIEQRDFEQAEKTLRQLASQVPDCPAQGPLRQKLDGARAAAEAERVQSEIRRVEDLMAVAAFDQAEAIARALTESCPDSQEVRDLAARVRREGETFAAEQRRRLFGEVERLAAARQWRKALASATRLLEAYPTSPESESVVAELRTLRENARIEEVRELRDRIGDLLERRRYAEAVAIAEDIVTRFPDTQAARQLGQQLDRLKGLARSGDGTVA